MKTTTRLHTTTRHEEAEEATPLFQRSTTAAKEDSGNLEPALKLFEWRCRAGHTACSLLPVTCLANAAARLASSFPPTEPAVTRTAAAHTAATLTRTLVFRDSLGSPLPHLLRGCLVFRATVLPVR